MRVTVVVPSLGVGGCERYVGLVARHLSRDADVIVVHQSVISGPVDVLLAGVAHTSMHVVEGTPNPIAQFRSSLASTQPEHVVVVLPLPYPEPGGPAPLDLIEAATSLAPTTAVFQLAHQAELRPQEERERAQRLLAGTDLRWVAVSEQNREALAVSFGLSKQFISVVPNGTTVPVLPTSPAGALSQQFPVLLQVGRLVRWKAQEDSIRALQLMNQVALLWLVGQGYDRERLAALADQCAVADRVAFLGERDDVLNLIARADVVLHPTLAEGASFALLEAMAAGRPIVASSAASNPELLRDCTDGWIHPPRCPHLQAACVDEALADRNEAERRGRAARVRVVTRFGMAVMIEGLKSVLERRS